MFILGGGMKRVCALCTLLSTLFISQLFSGQINDEWVVFDATQFAGKTGTAKTYTQTFTVPILKSQSFNLQLVNGNGSGGNRVTNATVKLNGVTVVSPAECTQQTASLTKAVTVQSSNTLQVTVNGTTGSYLTITCSKHLLPIHPIVECVQKNPNGTYTARFGYSNDNAYPVTVPVGLLNLFVPLPIDRSQPTVFQPGRQQNVFSVIFNGNALVWEVRGRITTATNSPSLACAGVDTIPPAMSITSPAEGMITSAASVQVSGTATDASPMSVTINGSAVTVDASGNFSGTVTLIEGLNTITIVATDAAGNKTTMTRKVTKDSIPPALVVTTPTDNTITNQTSITLSGTVTDASATTLTVNGSTVQVGTNGAFSTSVVLAEGVNTITVVSTDAAGNKTTVTRKVRKDTQSPIVNLTSPIDSLLTNQLNVTVSGTVRDSTAVTLTINGTSVPVGAGGAFSYNLAIIEGLNTITLVAIDAAGNQTTITRRVRRDTQAPFVSITSPIDSLLTNQLNVTVSGTVKDSTTIQLTVNGESIIVGVGGTFSSQLALAEGLNTFTVVATDAAGNKTTVTRRVRRDTQAPFVSITSPIDSLITNQVNVTVSGTVKDSTAVTLTINGTNVPVGVGGTFSYMAPLNEGLNTITIVTTDAAGNKTTVTRRVRRDTQSPVVSLTSPIDSLITNQLSITVSGTVADSTVVTLTVKIGSGTPSQLQVGTNGTFSSQLVLVEGMNTITVVATDAAGNQSTVVRHVNVQSIPTVLIITAPIDSVITNTAQITVRGTVSGLFPMTLTVNGTPVSIGPDSTFSTLVNLQEGFNTITVIATNSIGSLATVKRTVKRDTQTPQLTLISLEDGMVKKQPNLTIHGSVSDLTKVTVTVNELPVNMNPDGTFTYQLTLVEGRNTITFVVTDAAGNQTKVIRTVILDTKVPILNIISFANNAQTTDNVITVLGSVGDSSNISLTINGVAQTLSANGGFSTPVFLSYGSNTITFVAIDQAGNTITVDRTITRVPLPPDPKVVAPALDTTVTTLVMDATEFLYTGANPIQKGVTPGTINKLHLTVLRGRVFNKNLNPLSGVRVTILDHTEFGYTFSRSDGMYDIVVNGGEEVKVNFAKTGYLPAQRQVTASWATYASVNDVVLVQLDTAAHRVDFSQPEIVQGSSATDSLGTRRPTLFFNQGTQAKLVFQAYNYKFIGGCAHPYISTIVPDKMISIPIDSLVNVGSVTVRVKEYTVGPNAELLIPANLPQTVAYTFVAELTADEMLSAGAKDVRFDQPVSLYLENVMNFPVGLTVPMGCFNREKGLWETSENGRVIKILDTTGGIAAIDYNGDGIAEPADTLVAKGISLVEQQFLAHTYSAGQSIWRAEITHIGTYAGGFGMIAPNAVDPHNPLPDRYAKIDRDNIVAGSVIGVQNQTLGESVPITNTPMTMSYKSDRVFGRREAYCLDIPLTGTTIPEGMSKITLEIEIVGRKYDSTFVPQPNLTYHFEWDGIDAYGRRVQGQQNILTIITYCYPAQYTLPPDSKNCFATPSGQIIEQYIAARKETKRTQIWEGKIGAFDILSLGVGGWSLSLHHGYDCVGKILYKGTGEVRSANVMDNVINTIAGLPGDWPSNACRNDYEGMPASTIKIFPMANYGTLRFDSKGSLYFFNNSRICKIDTSGIISTFAGLIGENCLSNVPDTASGVSANCGSFTAGGIAQSPDGSWYISDPQYNVIWKISPDGEKTRFAGICYTRYGYSGSRYGGDGGPALNAYFNSPQPLAFGNDGCLYVGDQFNYRIRKISPDGIITTVAGTGVNGSSGDGGPAVLCTMEEPRGLTVASDGSILFCDYRSNRIRRITPDGIVKTFAGTDNPYGINTGDGGPALQARIIYPSDISVAKDGTVFINTDGKALRGIATDGYIKTIVGGGNTFWVDNGPATSTNLGAEPRIGIGPDGNLYVGEWPGSNAPSNVWGPRIFKVTPPLPGITLSEILIASEDGSERYVFTYSGRHMRTLDALTGVVKYSFGYNSDYKLMTITDVDSLVTHIERDANGKATAIISPYGVRTQLNLDSLGYLLQATNPASESNQFTYTSGGLMTSKTDARGNTYHYDYDSLGYLTKDMDPVGGYTNITRMYDPDSVGAGTSGYTVTAITAMGKTTKYRAEKLATGVRRFINTDANGLKTITVDSTDGSSYTITPDGMNTPLTQKPDPRFGMQSPLVNATAQTPGGIQSNVNQFRTITQITGTAVTGLQDSIVVNSEPFKTLWDGNQMMLKKISAEGRKTFTFYNEKAKVIKDSIPGLAATIYKYDTKGRRIEANQNGRRKTFGYDSCGRQSTVTDSYGRSTYYFYNGSGRLIRTVAPDSSEALFKYDKNGNVTAVTPPGKPEHTFDYSKVDLEILYTPPLADDSVRATAHTYTLDKELLKVLRSDSLNITIEYGGVGSLAGQPKKIYFDHGFLTNIFDTTNALKIGIIAPNGDSLKYQYDGTMLKKVAWTGSNGINSVKGDVAFTYNSNMQLGTETVLPIAANADSVNLKYDKDGLLTSIGIMKLGYDTNNSMLIADTVCKLITSYIYNTLGELASKETKFDSTIIFRTDYVRDSLGRILEKTETNQSIVTNYSYEYDIVGRLSQIKRNDTLVSVYTYDANRNRLTHSTPAKVDNGSYDTQDRLLSYSSTRFYYTQNGDLRMKVDTVNEDTTRYFYDAFGSLRSVMLPNGTNIDYLIDGSGRRVGKKINGQVTQKWLYSTSLRIVAELDSTNKIRSRFVYTSSENVPEYMVTGGTIYRLIKDHLGSVRQVVNAQTGSIVQRIDYDEFGNVLYDTNLSFTPFGFAGGLYDPITKLTRFGARDYDPSTGRWTVKDPTGFGGGNNQYIYVSADAINQKDPIGKDASLVQSNILAMNSLSQGLEMFSEWKDILVGLMFGVTTATISSLQMARHSWGPNNYPESSPEDEPSNFEPNKGNNQNNDQFKDALKLLGLLKAEYSKYWDPLHDLINEADRELVDSTMKIYEYIKQNWWGPKPWE
jgi:RHS repeat-associated protein